MTITLIEPTAALVLVELQGGTLANPAIQPVDTLVANAGALLTAFRERGMPVAFATIDGMAPGRNEVGSQPMDLPAAATSPVLPVASGDISVVRRGWSAFTGTDLHEQLTARGVTQVVFAGIATSFGIESSARTAADLGYNVVVVTDATKDMSAEAHDARVAGIFRILGETGTTDEVVALLK